MDCLRSVRRRQTLSSFLCSCSSACLGLPSLDVWEQATWHWLAILEQRRRRREVPQVLRWVQEGPQAAQGH